MRNTVLDTTMGISIFISFGALVLYILLILPEHAGASVDSGEDGKGPDAQTLVAMGKKLNNPLLRLIGYTILEEMCKMNPCGDWSRWSPCSSKRQRTFGTRTRVRQCGRQSQMCKSTAQSVNETEIGLCEGFCPEDYNITKGGFCLKLITDKLNKSTAETKCNAIGGSLVHIDSSSKSEATADLVSTFSKYEFWVDGQRSSIGSPWQYRNSTVSETDVLLNWGSGEPSNGSSELCNAYVLHRGAYYRFDRGCSSTYLVVCEILH